MAPDKFRRERLNAPLNVFHIVYMMIEVAVKVTDFNCIFINRGCYRYKLFKSMRQCRFYIKSLYPGNISCNLPQCSFFNVKGSVK